MDQKLKNVQPGEQNELAIIKQELQSKLSKLIRVENDLKNANRIVEDQKRRIKNATDSIRDTRSELEQVKGELKAEKDKIGRMDSNLKEKELELVQANINFETKQSELTEAERNLKAGKTEAERNLKAAKAEAERNLKAAKTEAERNLKAGKTEAERNLKAAKAEAERNLEVAKAEAARKWEAEMTKAKRNWEAAKAEAERNCDAAKATLEADKLQLTLKNERLKIALEKMDLTLAAKDIDGWSWLLFSVKFALEACLGALEFRANREHGMKFLIASIVIAFMALLLNGWEVVRSCKEKKVVVNRKIIWSTVPWLPEMYSCVIILLELGFYILKLWVPKPVHVSPYTCMLHSCILVQKLTLRYNLKAAARASRDIEMAS